MSPSQQQGIIGRDDNGSVQKSLRIPALAWSRQRRTAELLSEVNPAEVFMVEDTPYESGKQILPGAATYLYNLIGP